MILKYADKKAVHRRLFIVHRIGDLTVPPVASDSDAAARRQTQTEDIASSNPRLVKK